MTTHESFLNDVKDHSMTIENDSGVFRTVFFGARGSGNQHFRLITWPGHLAISGDMGDFVFSRTKDMFDFFRSDAGHINTGYWGEKLTAVSCFGGYEKFDWDEAVETLSDHLISYNDDRCPEEIKSKLDKLLRFTEQDEHGFIELVRNWDEGDTGLGMEPSDLGRTNKLSYQYVWCLHAVVWGINKYDDFEKSEDI